MVNVLEVARTRTAAITEEIRAGALLKIEQDRKAKEYTARQRRFRQWRLQRKNHARGGRIVTGLQGISALAQTEEVKALIYTTGRPLTLWSFDYMIPSSKDAGRYEWEAYLKITATDIQFVNRIYIGDQESRKQHPDHDLLDVTLSHDSAGSWRNMWWLQNDAAHSRPVFRYDGNYELIYDELRLWKNQVATTRDLLWDAIADCANPRLLQRYFLRSMDL